MALEPGPMQLIHGPEAADLFEKLTPNDPETAPRPG